MSRREYWMMLVAPTLAGMVGGAVSAWYLISEPVFAQQRQKVVNAEEFLLVDKAGKTRAGLGLGPDGGIGLIMVDKNGVKAVKISPDDPVVFKIEENSKLLWSAP